MFKQVVWASDGSDAADRALELARTLVQDSEGELLCVHCKEIFAGRGGAFTANVDEDKLQEKIEAQVEQLTHNGIKATLETAATPVGGAAHVIADAAQERDADVIVVGTRGRTPLGGLLLGSVTQRLLHIARCPVLAVPAVNGLARD